MSTIETGISNLIAEAAPPSRLRDLDLAPHYSHEDGDLVNLCSRLGLRDLVSAGYRLLLTTRWDCLVGVNGSAAPVSPFFA